MGKEVEKVNNEMTAEDLGLNERQKRFCEYYTMSKSAGQAYMKAYGTDEGKELQIGSCYTNGSKLLRKEKIKNYLNILRREIKEKNIMSAEEVVSELVNIAKHAGTKTSDKLRALELIGKTQALFMDKLQMDSNSNIEINLTGFENERKVIESEPVERIESKE